MNAAGALVEGALSEGAKLPGALPTIEEFAKQYDYISKEEACRLIEKARKEGLAKGVLTVIEAVESLANACEEVFWKRTFLKLAKKLRHFYY